MHVSALGTVGRGSAFGTVPALPQGQRLLEGARVPLFARRLSLQVLPHGTDVPQGHAVSLLALDAADARFAQGTLHGMLLFLQWAKRVCETIIRKRFLDSVRFHFRDGISFEHFCDRNSVGDNCLIVFMPCLKKESGD